MKLIIKETIGSRCIVKEDGQRVYDAIHDSLGQGETVILDFSGISQFASPFFNFAIGQLLKDIKVENLRNLLKLENLDSTGRLVVDRVIENAGRYHSDIDYKKIVDSILEEQARESD